MVYLTKISAESAKTSLGRNFGAGQFLIGCV